MITVTTPTHKPPSPVLDLCLKSYLVPHEGYTEVVFKGPFGGSVRAAFDQAYAELQGSFPLLVVLNLTKITNVENKRGINALADFVLSLRQKGNSLRYVGMCRALGEPLMALNLVQKDELGAPPPGAVAPIKGELPPPAKRDAMAAAMSEAAPQPAKTKTRTKSKTKLIDPAPARPKRQGMTKLLKAAKEKAPQPEAPSAVAPPPEESSPEATRTGISLVFSNTKSLVLERGSEKPPSPLPPAPRGLMEIPMGKAEGFQNLLEHRDSEAGKQLWKSFEESPLLVPVKSKAAPDEAEFLFLSKDKTHALFIDRGALAGTLSQKIKYLFAQQCARMLVDAGFPLASATVVLPVLEGSPASFSLLAAFDETYKMPTINLTRGVFSACRIQGRATRPSRNTCRYPVALTYKDQKLEIPITVKIVELPAAFFE